MKRSKRSTEDVPSIKGLVQELDPTKSVKFHNRFQTRLLMWLIALSAATSAVAGLVYYRRQLTFVQTDQATRGRTLISNLAGQSELGAYSGDRAFLTVPARRTYIEEDVSFVAIYNRRGETLIRLAKPDAPPSKALPKKLLTSLLDDTSGRPIQRPRPAHIDFYAPIVSVQEDVEHGMFGDTATAGSTVLGVAHLGLSRRPAMQKLDEVLSAGIHVALIILALGVLVALFLSRRVSQPILALVSGADELRRGKLGVQIDVKRSDELGMLADSFNRMSKKLRKNVAALEHLNKNLESEVNRRTVALRRSRDFIALLNTPLQLRTLLDSALEALVRITGAHAGAIYFGDKHKLDLAVARGLHAAAFDRDTRLNRALLRRATQSEGAFVADEIPEHSELASELPPQTTLLYVALRYREQLEGVVALVLDAPPLPDHIDFAEHAGSQLAIAVSNARTYAAAERLARELERRNVALLQQRDQLQELNRLKSEFLANVSHELRTPLNAIVGYSELLADGIYGEVNDHQLQSLHGIGENSASLLELINDILDLSKVEAGKTTIELEPVDLIQMTRDVVDSASSLVRDKPYAITLQLPQSPIELVTDAAKVRRILVNLLSNAIKFTSEGSVTVKVVSTRAGGARIEVHDTGVGIREQDLNVIFDEFRQVDGSSTREHGGTGLGLAISKKLAELVGGTIEVESIYDMGSTFALVLPRHAPSDAGEGARSSGRGKRTERRSTRPTALRPS